MGTQGGRRCFQNAGQIYYGDVLEAADGACTRHGQGIQIVTAVTVAGDKVVWGRYKGAWKKGQMNGTGTYRWSDGSVYEGSFLDGRLHGCGRLTWPEGSVYDGMWAAGEMTGQGSFYSAFEDFTVQGVFHRNWLRRHDGRWVDVVQQREEHRVARLQIGAMGPGPGAAPAAPPLCVMRCAPGDLGACVASVLQGPPHAVPLVLADTSCPDSSAPAAARAPLWCLELGDHSCAPATTVHLAYAAAEKRRLCDSPEIFRAAIREALLTYRTFALVFGDDRDPSNPHDEVPLPAEWRLDQFFDGLSLPIDLFDLPHFHGSGDSELFVPGGARRGDGAWQCPRLPSPAAANDRREGSVTSAPAGAGQAEGGSSPQPPPEPPPLAPATVHLLHFALVSLCRVGADLDEDAIRAHVGHRFAAHVPLHRVCAIVVSAA